MTRKHTLAKCEMCTLINDGYVPSQKNIGFGSIVLLGEAPGFNEVQAGMPFVGKAGIDLMSILADLGKSRSEFDYVNVCSCRPTIVFNDKTNNRTPTEEEIRCCNARMLGEIDDIQPKAIVTLGRTPYFATMGSMPLLKNVANTSQANWLGKYTIVHTYHPSAINYSGGASSDEGMRIRNSIKDAISEAIQSTITERQLKLM